MNNDIILDVYFLFTALVLVLKKIALPAVAGIVLYGFRNKHKLLTPASWLCFLYVGWWTLMPLGIFISKLITETIK